MNNAVKGALMMTAANVAFCFMVWLIRYASYLNIQTTTLFHESFPLLSMAGAAILIASSGLSVISDLNK